MDRLEKEFGIVTNYDFEEEERENKKFVVKSIIAEIFVILATIAVIKVVYCFTHSFIITTLVTWIVFDLLEIITEVYIKA